MDGVVYFGPHSIDVSRWVNQSSIDNALDEISDLVKIIHENGYARTNAPNDWSFTNLLSITFWEKLEKATNKNNQLIGYVSHKLFDEVLKDCIDAKRSYEEAENHLTDENPDEGRSEYYGAIKLAEWWPGVPKNIHVSNDQDLFRLAQKFLMEIPFNEGNYTERCHKIFPNLIFHSNFSDGLKGHGSASPPKDAVGKKIRAYPKAPEVGINGFSSSVTKSLATLNNIIIQDRPTAEILSEVQATSGFKCTAQGSDKQHLKFQYVFEDGSHCTINCEFHIKINKNNINDGVDYQDRIYFGFVEYNGSKKIFVAHSGKHLN